MEKRRRIEAINGGFSLPKATIQHIQSFLSGKEAAKTSILSKSWHIAWSTRPNIVLNRLDFGTDCRNSGDEDRFWEFAKKTMQRYEETNLEITSFMQLINGEGSVSVEHYSIAEELIVKAMKMGTIDFNFEIRDCDSSFILPREVLESETLIELSVTGCKISVGDGRKIRCSKLKSLSLDKILSEDDLLSDIISNCPLIEKLILPIDWGLSLGSVVDGEPINVYRLCKLKYLWLGGVDVDTSFFSDLLFKFPYLKDLTLDYCSGYHGSLFVVRSHSLEYLSFRQQTLLTANFDVPSIRKFEFRGEFIPLVSFETTSRRWESDVFLQYPFGSTKGFLKLNKLLTSLSLSKITLSLIIDSIGVSESMNFQGLQKPAVEHLTMKAPYSVWFVLMECVLRSCRPKFIMYDPVSIPYTMRMQKRYNDSLESLCKRFAPGTRVFSSIINQDMFSLQELEELNVERFEESVADWQPLSWKTLLEDTSRPNKYLGTLPFQLRCEPEPYTKKIRLQLKWAQ